MVQLSFLLINYSLTADNPSSMNSTLKLFTELRNLNDKILITPNKNSAKAVITSSIGRQTLLTMMLLPPNNFSSQGNKIA